MKVLLSYIRLVRPLNLLMILFTLYMVRFCLILPLRFFSFLYLDASEVAYALFSLAFVFMAAAGYIINDYYDIEIDKINKPDKIIIGNNISVRSALTAYVTLNVCGVITGFWSCYKTGIPLLGTLFLFYLIALWLYSYKLKSTFLWGNILVSLCLGIVPLAGVYVCSNGALNSNIYYFGWGLSFFAFLSSLIREIVKDMQDREGDVAAGCRTLAIVLGPEKTKRTVQLLVLLMIALLAFLQVYWVCGNILFFFMPLIIYCVIFIQLPCFLILWKINKASVAEDYKKISRWIKVIMFAGISFFFVFALEIWDIQKAVGNF